MNLLILAGCLWIFTATVTALMPMKYQIYPAWPLLVSAPILIFWAGYDLGWAYGAFGLFAFLSMFRKPLRFLTLYAMGRETWPPHS